MQIVEVTWLDAHVTLDECSVSDSKKIKPISTKTVAYLMSETDDGLNLATDKYPNDPKHGKIINHIPWEMVVEWEYLI